MRCPGKSVTPREEKFEKLWKKVGGVKKNPEAFKKTFFRNFFLFENAE
jgi:hypothetical protein